jgi:glycine/D-amino acid oxidase-like deaminating enzyme
MSSELKTASSSNQSLWVATTTMPTYSPLQENIHTEIGIVGAGIAGLTIAYLLTQAGKAVVLLDDGPVAGGMTGVTTAHLSTAIDDRYFELERLHGQTGARLAAESHTAAIDRIEAMVENEKIACDFEWISSCLSSEIIV